MHQPSILLHKGDMAGALFYVPPKHTSSLHIPVVAALALVLMISLLIP